MSVTPIAQGTHLGEVTEPLAQSLQAPLCRPPWPQPLHGHGPRRPATAQRPHPRGVARKLGEEEPPCGRRNGGLDHRI